MAGELAVAQAEDRQRIGRLLVAASSPKRLRQTSWNSEFQQIGPALEHLVVDRRRAGELADAAGARLAHAQQPDHVGAVGVEAQRAVGQGAGIGGEEGAPLLVLVPGRRYGRLAPSSRIARISSPLRFWKTGVPICVPTPNSDPAQIVLVVFVDREAAQLDHAASRPRVPRRRRPSRRRGSAAESRRA